MCVTTSTRNYRVLYKLIILLYTMKERCTVLQPIEPQHQNGHQQQLWVFAKHPWIEVCTYNTLNISLHSSLSGEDDDLSGDWGKLCN